MKAARIYEYGGPDVFRIEEVPDPQPKPNDVVIQVVASSVNPVDYKIRGGHQRGLIRLKFPWILGMDVSGVVVAKGDAVTKFSIGDEVFSSPTHSRPGTYAELVAIDAGAVALKPENISHEEAASLPLVALTAWGCLVTAARLKSGEKVLIQAGAGGVGTIAIQIAKSLGAQVATTCSTKNVEFLKGLGADVVVDYKKSNFEDELKDYDVVLESMGGEIHDRSLKVLRKGGRLATINSNLPEATERYGPNLGVLAVGARILSQKISAKVRRGVAVKMVVRKCSGEDLASIGRLVSDGKIKPVVAEVFPLDEIANAHRAIETGRTRGKNVISVSGDA